jgi:hypothetical protein
MPNENTNAAKLGTLQRFFAALTTNAAELPQLEQSRLLFGTLLTNLQEAGKQQAALVASKQEASRQFRTLLTECERLATVLRVAVKQHYGIRAEKLAEFNLQPFRGRNRLAKARVNAKAAQAPEAPAPSPAQPAPDPSAPNQ